MMSSCLSEWRQHYFRSFTLFRPFRGLDKGVKYTLHQQMSHLLLPQFQLHQHPKQVTYSMKLIGQRDWEDGLGHQVGKQ